MITEPRIFMVVEMRAVKPRQAMWIVWKMRRDPIHDDADSFVMAGIDKRHKLFRRAEPTRRSKIAGRLISP